MDLLYMEVVAVGLEPLLEAEVVMAAQAARLLFYFTHKVQT